jgi:hypothetical protein
MGLFNFNTEQIVSNLTPINKRVSGFLRFLYGLFEGVKDIFFLSEASYTGQPSIVDIHNTASTYSLGAIVQDIASGNIYESLISSNTDTLDNTASWRKISSSIIGMQESVRYDASNISLTYALNKRYQTQFLPDPDVFVSDINITGIVDGLPMFQIGGVEANSSYINAANPDSSDGYIAAANTASYQVGFTVNVPSAWWPTYFTTLTDCELSIRNYLKPLVPIGIYYEVTDY